MKLKQAKEGFLTYMKAYGYSPATVNLYSYVLDALAGFLPDKHVEAIKPSDLTRYFAYLRDGYKPDRKNGDERPLSGSTLQNHWKGIRTFFKWAEEDLELKSRPDLKIKLHGNNPKVIQPFAEGEVKALLKAAEFSEVAPGNRKAYTMRKRTADRDIAIILTLLDTGLRIGELCRLDVGDVNLETGEVYIAPFGNSNRKTKSRVVHLGKASKRAIWRYLANCQETERGDALFVTDRGARRITSNSVRLLLADCAQTRRLPFASSRQNKQSLTQPKRLNSNVGLTGKNPLPNRKPAGATQELILSLSRNGRTFGGKSALNRQPIQPDVKMSHQSG